MPIRVDRGGVIDVRDSSTPCAQLSPGEIDNMFFPHRYTRLALNRAKAICARCPVRIPCLNWALAHPWEMGVWGGTTEAERIRMRRSQKGALR